MSAGADDWEEEICPNCGDLALLDEVTGWCPRCANGGTNPLSCLRCGTKLNDVLYKFCSSCRYMRWLEQNADEIERTMAAVVVSAGKAKELVRADNRPKCLCCDRPIKGGQRGKNYFCSRTKACRTGQNSYHYYRNRGDRKALEKALVSATRERLIANAASRHHAA